MLLASRRPPDYANSPEGVASLHQQKAAQMEPWGLFLLLLYHPHRANPLLKVHLPHHAGKRDT